MKTEQVEIRRCNQIFHMNFGTEYYHDICDKGPQ